ncbi:HPr family phosphocarrier protein [Acidisoma cladoniae]|uniref:HPr family phosphocarrier protein n=1 Tax=Acidisoma cladoniae TaxID=3040935 RepID=UPI0025505310|nr:HPr family phosphocarrier protein [Acidisoma sp. PAMC 29798]
MSEYGQGDAGTSVTVRHLLIINKRGLHARAAAKLVTTAEQFGASIDVAKDGQTVSARSIMGLMMLGAGQGSKVTVSAEGWDAKEALDAVASLIESGFHEED